MSDTCLQRGESWGGKPPTLLYSHHPTMRMQESASPPKQMELTNSRKTEATRE